MYLEGEDICMRLCVPVLRVSRVELMCLGVISKHLSSGVLVGPMRYIIIALGKTKKESPIPFGLLDLTSPIDGNRSQSACETLPW